MRVCEFCQTPLRRDNTANVCSGCRSWNSPARPSGVTFGNAASVSPEFFSCVNVFFREPLSAREILRIEGVKL